MENYKNFRTTGRFIYVTAFFVETTLSTQGRVQLKRDGTR